MTIHPTTPQIQKAILTAMNVMGSALVGSAWQPVTECPVTNDEIDAMMQEVIPYTPPVCSLCSRERDPFRPMDAYDYSPLQVMAGLPVGWYHGDDGEVCPERMTNTLAGDAL